MKTILLITSFVIIGSRLVFAWGTDPTAACIKANRAPCDAIKNKQERTLCLDNVTKECRCLNWDPAILAKYGVKCP